MKLKKVLSIVLAASMAMSLMTGCGDDSDNEKETDKGKATTITFMTNVVGNKADALEKAIKDFETESGYKVEFSAPGSDYEELMKVKMGSNELPDVFTTHGWSVARYGEYLKPVNDMSFFSKIDQQILPAITAKDGSVYVLPVDVDIAGIVYNEDVLADAGVTVDSIKTWKDFADACEKIKAKGHEPIHMGGKDSWPIGQFFDWVAPSYYVTDETNNQIDALKSGSFDEKIWEELGQMMKDWKDAGYFNEDVLTADYNADMEALAKGEAAFVFYGNNAVSDAMAINAEVKLGMMPIPSNNANDEPSLITGEDIAVGIWKDTKNSKEAQELLEYLAKPEVMSEIAKAAGNKAGLQGVTSDIGNIQTYLDKYSSVQTYPYFDREYLPSGLWDTMCLTGAEILAGTKNAVVDAAKEMKDVFNSKFTQ